MQDYLISHYINTENGSIITKMSPYRAKFEPPVERVVRDYLVYREELEVREHIVISCLSNPKNIHRHIYMFLH